MKEVYKWRAILSDSVIKDGVDRQIFMAVKSGKNLEKSLDRLKVALILRKQGVMGLCITNAVEYATALASNAISFVRGYTYRGDEPLDKMVAQDVKTLFEQVRTSRQNVRQSTKLEKQLQVISFLIEDFYMILSYFKEPMYQASQSTESFKKSFPREICKRANIIPPLKYRGEEEIEFEGEQEELEPESIMEEGL